MLRFLLETTDNTAGTNSGSKYGWIIYVVLIVLVVLMLVLPTITNRRRMKEYNQMVDRLRVGDEVRTIGGIIGRVTRINKKGDIATFVLETGAKGSKTTMEFDMNAVGSVLTSTYEPEKEEKAEVKTETKAEPTAETKAQGPSETQASAEQPVTENNDNTAADIEKQISGKKPRTPKSKK